MKFPNEEGWTEEHRQAMEDAITKARERLHETVQAQYRDREVHAAFLRAKAQLNITDELKVKHGSVYTQAPPHRLHENIFFVLIAWAADMAYEAVEQIHYAWRQRPWKN